jgi:recombination protein RecA
MAKAAGTEISPARIYRADEIVPGEVLPTKHPNLDWAIGMGGLPTGRIITYYGPPACGKTTLALEAIRNAQERGGIGVFFDFEAKLDLAYVEKLGIDMDFFIHIIPAHIQEAMSMTEKSLKALREDDPEAPAVFVWDSVSSAKGKQAYESDWEDYNFAGEARVYADKLPRFARLVTETKAIVIGIAQKRIKMDGGFVQNKVGAGNAWLHHTTTVLSWVKKKVQKGKTTEPASEISTIEITKNQVGAPLRQARLLMRYGEGYDEGYSMIEAGVRAGIIEKSGAYYSYGSDRIAQGAEKAAAALRDNPKLWAEIEAVLRADYTRPLVGYDTGGEEGE